MRRTYAKEEHVKQDVKEILKELGILYFMPRGGPYAVVGIGDFVCCVRGLYVEIETKFGYNKQTTMQEVWGKKVIAHGGLYLLVTEKNIHELYAELRQLKELRASP